MRMEICVLYMLRTNMASPRLQVSGGELKPNETSPPHSKKKSV